MAKAIGFIGGLRGKSGNVVFKKGENGSTIMTPYQPVVKNPRTEAQMLQRAKMNVAGQFSELCSAKLIAPLGMGSALRNRSEFTRNLLNNTRATLTDGNYVAKFDPSIVKFSRGTEQLLTTIETPVVTAQRVTISIDTVNVPNDLLGKYGERLVIGILDNSTNSLFDTVRYIDHIITQNNTAEDVVFNLAHPLAEGQTVVVWRMAFTLSPEGMAAHSEDIHISTDGDITAIMATSALTLVERWGETHVVAIVPFAQA